LHLQKKNIGARTLVDKLIASEMKRMPKPRDPSTLFPDIELFKDNELIQQELERVRKGKPMENALDMTRYQLEPPTSQPSSNASDGASVESTITPSASEELPEGRATWIKALENADAQMEHQNQRILNLELVQKFGGNAWNVHNYQLEYDLSLLRKAVDEKKAEVIELNKLRKRDQVRRNTHWETRTRKESRSITHQRSTNYGERDRSNRLDNAKEKRNKCITKPACFLAQQLIFSSMWPSPCKDWRLNGQK